MTGGFGGPPPMGEPKYNKVAPPRGLCDVPRYVKQVVCGFFSRLFYIFGMVWKTGPFILVTLVLISVFEGVAPIIGSILSKEILNELQTVITDRALDGLVGEYTQSFFSSAVMFFIIAYFIF